MATTHFFAPLEFTRTLSITTVSRIACGLSSDSDSAVSTTAHAGVSTQGGRLYAGWMTIRDI